MNSEPNRLLLENMGALPPDPEELQRYTPWRTAMRFLIVGHMILVFRLEVWNLQYLLPLLGSVLLVLGGRMLRKSSWPFRLYWIISMVQLAVQIVCFLLRATPLAARLEPENIPLVVLLSFALLDLTQTVLLYAGIRRGFYATGRKKGRDPLRWGVLAYGLSVGLAVWATLIPLTKPSLLGVIPDPDWAWLQAGRGWAAVALQAVYLICLILQSRELEGRGYSIVPTPVHVGNRAVGILFFAVPVLLVPLLLLAGSRVPMPEEQPASITITAAQEESRVRLTQLGLPAEAAELLDGTELGRCREAVAVVPMRSGDTRLNGETLLEREDGWLRFTLAGGSSALQGWTVYLADGQVRCLFFFRCEDLPRLRLQEMLYLRPDRNAALSDFAARLVWTTEGDSKSVSPDVHTAGGEREEDIQWETVAFPDEVRQELEKLGGHLQLCPWIAWTIPEEADSFQGWLAYTAHPERNSAGFAEVWLFRQNRLCYPFAEIQDLSQANRMTAWVGWQPGWNMQLEEVGS